jgi:hypothetical protein
VGIQLGGRLRPKSGTLSDENEWAARNLETRLSNRSRTVRPNVMSAGVATTREPVFAALVGVPEDARRLAAAAAGVMTGSSTDSASRDQSYRRAIGQRRRSPASKKGTS